MRPLAPGLTADPERVVHLAQTLVAASPTSYAQLSLLGSALYRADRFEEAFRRLSDAEAVQPSGSNALHAFWLAMAHARLGHAGEARQWLDKGTRWLEQAVERGSLTWDWRLDKSTGWLERAVENGSLTWDQRLALQLLRREAEALVQSGSPSN